VLLAVPGGTGCRTPDRTGQTGDASPATDRVAPDDAAATARPIELFSWWAHVGDADGLGALSAAHQRRYPGDVLVNATAGLSGEARSTLRQRMLNDEPPDTFQANAGKDFMQWVMVNGIDDASSKLVPLDGVIDDVATWRRVVPKPVLDLLTYDGKLYGVPADIHRLNTIFYNRKVFRTYGLSEPKTVADFRSMAHKLEGTGVHLFGLGTREPWTLSLLAFECLLVAREGPAFYESYFRGHLRPDDPRLVADLNALLGVLALANDDYAQLSWLQAVDLVLRGKAAMTVMGDWARASFANLGVEPGDDYGEIPFPDTENVFVFTADAFPLPKGARNREGAIRLLRTIGSVEGQRAMNGAKDALSARTDVPPANDPVLLKKFALLKKGPLVLALSGLVPGRFADDVSTGLADAALEHDVEPAVHTLRSRYALLK
jgi:glucose/mannose transport system substrate-binding protein